MYSGSTHTVQQDLEHNPDVLHFLGNGLTPQCMISPACVTDVWTFMMSGGTPSVDATTWGLDNALFVLLMHPSLAQICPQLLQCQIG